MNGKKYPRNPELTSIYIIKGTRNKLLALKKELGFRSYDALLNHLALELKDAVPILVADYEVIFTQLDTRPAIITGMSGAGKSSAVRDLLSIWPGNVFAVDITGIDYPDLEPIDLGKFFSTNWARKSSKPQRLRFIPNPNVEISRAEAATVFSHLNFIKKELQDWVIIVDEAHRFSKDENLRSFLIEARKFVRKVLIVTTDWKVYEGIARVFKPGHRRLDYI